MLHPRVLIADDSACMRACIRAVLSALPVTLAEAADGSEAFSLLLAQPHELVITDLRMTPVDGAKLIMATRLLPFDRRPRIIVHSADAHDPPQEFRQALSHAHERVSKSAPPADLLTAVHLLLPI